MTKVKIEIQNLTKSFGDKKILDNVNLKIFDGSSTVIIGGSGSGKSVFIKTIIGIIKADAGKVFIEKDEMTSIPEAEKFNLMSKCGFLFQGGALFDSLTVKDNITFYASRKKNLSDKELGELAEAKLRSVGLNGDILDKLPAELSGGMQKRVAFARAIASDPEIIFFDEPTTGLDPIMANIINELLIKVREERNTTTITITHDVNCLEKVATHVAMLYQGKIIWYGTKDEVHSTNNEIIRQFIAGSTSGPIKV